MKGAEVIALAVLALLGWRILNDWGGVGTGGE